MTNRSTTHVMTTSSSSSTSSAQMSHTASQMLRSPDFLLKSITARSRRKRRISRSPHLVITANNSIVPPNQVNCNPSDRIKPQPYVSGSPQQSSRSSLLTYLALLVLYATCATCTSSLCATNSWWDPIRDRCIPCTECEGDMIPLRPCQVHRDTICGSIYDLKIDWVVLAKTEPNWKERRKSEDLQFSLEQHLTHEEAIPLDWQTAALFMAVLACLLFFIVAACILIHHMRQWRRMERRLDQDVEELSTKLMAKLAEVQSLEGGTFFIGNADALRVPTTFQPQHVLLPDKSGKHQERRILKTLQPGNVYIEESSSKG